MPDDCIPKALFFGELAIGKRSVGALRKRYKDTIKSSLKAVQIDPSTIEEYLAADRGRWRRTIRLGCQRFEEDRIHVARKQRRTRKERERHQQHSPPPVTTAVFPCDQCGRSCLSKIELFSHTRWHTTQRRRNNEDGSVVPTDKPTTTIRTRLHCNKCCTYGHLR